MFTTASYIFFCNFPFLERDERSSERFPVTLNNSCWKRSAAAAVFVVVGYCFSVSSSSSSSYRLFIWQVFFSFFLTECPFVAAWPCCRPCSQQTQTDTHTHTHKCGDCACDLTDCAGNRRLWFCLPKKPAPCGLEHSKSTSCSRSEKQSQ